MLPLLSSNINPVIIVVIAVVVTLLVVACALLLIFRSRKGNKGKAKVSDSEWIDALGGQDNILEASAIGSRLSVKLNDKEVINRDKLKELGVSSILVMSNKVTLVIEKQAEKVAEAINHSLNKE